MDREVRADGFIEQIPANETAQVSVPWQPAHGVHQVTVKETDANSVCRQPTDIFNRRQFTHIM